MKTKFETLLALRVKTKYKLMTTESWRANLTVDEIRQLNSEGIWVRHFSFDRQPGLKKRVELEDTLEFDSWSSAQMMLGRLGLAIRTTRSKSRLDVIAIAGGKKVGSVYCITTL